MALVKLYDVPRNTKIVLRDEDCELKLLFSHIDGMYSYCTNDQGIVIHLAAWTEVEIDE
jgi:hypothetical protein